MTSLAKEFPTLEIEVGGAQGRGDSVIDMVAWGRSLSFGRFDEAVQDGTTDRLLLAGEASLVHHACEVLTRYQRWMGRRNSASSDSDFDRVLATHVLMYSLEKPHVRLDFDHALDTWQWVLRLSPDASRPLQLAALFHDIERTESEPQKRIEHRASSYEAFKERHAHRGSVIAFDLLTGLGVERAIAARTRDLIACHERRIDDREVALLNDADGLSFFSLNSSGYLESFGAFQTRRKINYTLARIGRGARFRMAAIRLRPDVETLFGSVFRA